MRRGFPRAAIRFTGNSRKPERESAPLRKLTSTSERPDEPARTILSRLACSVVETPYGIGVLNKQLRIF